MLRELFTYLKTKASKEAKAFGHLYESIAIKEREKRCKSFWLPHRTKCKNFISSHLKLAKAFDRVLILGSGPLHEIPIDILSTTFRDVDLIDIVHLSETKNKYSHLKNIHFIEADITELEKKILHEKKIINQVPTFFQNQKYDLIISANLLTQLSYHLRNFLEKKAVPKLTDVELEKFCYQVSYDHYQYITGFQCPVILITDIETEFIGIHDELIDKQMPYLNFPLPAPKDSWLWNLAPRPEVSKDYSVRMKVAAFILNY